jgi:hypothetical protein
VCGQGAQLAESEGLRYQHQWEFVDGVRRSSAGTLIAFEKGRSWPRRKTLAKLEEVLNWSPGTIVRIRKRGRGRAGRRGN